MPLTFNFPKSVCNAEHEITDKDILVWKDIIVWSCMILDMQGVSDNNLLEWEYRLGLINNAGYYIGNEKRKGVNVPLDIVKKCIGLEVNVCQMPRKKWLMNKFIRLLENGISHEAKEYKLKERR